MANWAIVIGIDKYWTPAACLSGAVRDALRMREWLLDLNGGGVSPQNLFLLLSPNEPEEVPQDLKYLPGTQELIIKVIERVVQQSGGEGDRLFFHYSGHGLNAWINFSEEEALVPQDFTDQLTIRSLRLRSILEYFEATRIREQFFFIDACRNIPWEGDFRIGEMSWARRRDPSQPAIQQFVFYATSPGIKASENGLAGNEQGAFTQSLLDGLRGRGKAKVWDFMTGEYIVRVDRLFDYLVSEMERKRISVAEQNGVQVFQVPRLGGERGALGGSNPVLARFSADTMDEESLDILVDPFIVEAQASVEVVREGRTVAQQAPIAQIPVTFKLPPKEYIVYTRALEFEPEEKRRPVELYDSQQVTIKLIPKRDTPVTSDAVVIRGVERRYRAQAPSGNLSEDLQLSVRVGKQFIQTYSAFIDRADRAELEEQIKQAEQALEDDSSVERRRAAQALANRIFGCGTASQLFVAERLMQDAPPKEAKRIAEAVRHVRTAHADNDQAKVERFRTTLRLEMAQLMARRPEEVADRNRPKDGLQDLTNVHYELKPTPLIVSASDPVAPLEITYSEGEVLEIGYGYIEGNGLRPGFYRARLVTPEGDTVERLLEVPDMGRVTLNAPKLPQEGLLPAMMKHANFSVRRDNTLKIERTISPIATAQVSTILLLAGSAAMHGEHAANTRRLRNLGVTPLSSTTQPDAESGVQALFGIESDVRGRADEYSLRLWSQDEAVPDSVEHSSKISGVEGLAEFARATRPGNYWLAVQSREQKPLVFSLKTLPRRLTMVIFHVNSKNEARVFQYLLPFPNAKGFEPEMLRRLELIQRFYLGGRLDHAYKFAKDLLNSSDSDPLAVCLGGYLLLRMSRVEEAGRIAHQMIESFNEMSDGFVLKAEYEASQGRPEAAAEASLAALERGMPVFSDGLVRLFDSVRRYHLKHSQAGLLTSMFKSRARGIIWSAWSPESIAPGSLLSPAIASGAEV